ncbi:hypothetical protein YC2023_062431 [Brassica napus]
MRSKKFQGVTKGTRTRYKRGPKIVKAWCIEVLTILNTECVFELGLLIPPRFDSLKISSPLLTKKQAHRRFGRGGVGLLLIEEQFSTNYGSELGKIMLDTTFEERDLLNEKTVGGAMKMQVEAKHKKRVQARFLSLKAVAFKMVFVYIDSGFDILIIVPCRTRRGVLIAVKSQKRGIPS